MMILRTANELEFEIKWIGIASIDGVLRFGIVGSNIQDIIDTFTIPENCTTLTRDYDGEEVVFEGFTVFRGVNINYMGEVIVSMSKV